MTAEEKDRLAVIELKAIAEKLRRKRKAPAVRPALEMRTMFVESA